MDLTILPFRSKFDFVGSFVCLAALNTWTIGTVAPVNFYAKYHVGQPRPEVRPFVTTDCTTMGMSYSFTPFYMITGNCLVDRQA
jgi:hypothetical protein